MERLFHQTSLSKYFCVALCVLHHQLLIQPLYGFIHVVDILDYAKQSFLEWVSIINDLLGKVQLEWVLTMKTIIFGFVFRL